MSIAETASQTQITRHKGTQKMAFNAAIDDLELDPVEFRVYCHILRRGECWESVAKQAAHCKVSESTYRRALKRLVYDHKLVVFTERPGLTTIYRAVHSGEWKHAVQMPSTPNESDSPPLADMTPTPSRFDQGGVSNPTGEPLADLTPKVLPIEVNTQEGGGEEVVDPETHLRRLIGLENFNHPQIQSSWRSWYSDVHTPHKVAEIWKEAHQQHDRPALFHFVDVLNGRRQRSRPQRAQPENFAPPAPAHNFERFEEVMTPNGVHTLLDVFPNGQVVFEDTPDVWRVHEIQPLNAPGAAA